VANIGELDGNGPTPRVGAPNPERFLVAFSFAGEERSLVRPVAEALGDLLGREKIFYDDWYISYLAGENAEIKLQDIYKNRSMLVVSAVSESYGRKDYPLAEAQGINALRVLIRRDTNEAAKLRWLPLRVGEGDIEGVMAETTHMPDIRKITTLAATNLILERLAYIDRDCVAHVKKQVEPPPIFLANPTPDLRQQHTRLREMILSAGWPVITPMDYPPKTLALYEQRIDADLRQSRAYVQMIGPEDTSAGHHDRLQFEAASRLGVKRFCYRSGEIDLATVKDPAHRDLLLQADICSGFDDFKRHIEAELGILKAAWKMRDAVATRQESAPSALVRVVVRSRNRKDLWKEVFDWLDKQPGILPNLMEEEDNLIDMYAAEPCDGFLLACDGSSVDEGTRLNRTYIEQCRQIQLSEKLPDRQPPLGVIYWPPPDAEWSRILTAKAAKMTRTTRDMWEPALESFLVDVRKVVADRALR
jgi:hypothetical protein